MGYSGIYDDVFMESIQKRLKNDVPFNYYWFCYSKDDYEKLPNWLKNNKQVKFILPKIDDVYRELNIFYFNDKTIEFDKMPSSIILKKLIKDIAIDFYAWTFPQKRYQLVKIISGKAAFLDLI